jgi:hypothetical protein
MPYTLSEDRLETALEHLCDKLIEKGILQEGEKKAAIETVKNTLQETYKDGIPQDLFTDPNKQKTLFMALISSALMEKNSALTLDLDLLFKAELQPTETKPLFKKLLTNLNDLEPNPAKQRKEEEIEELIDLLTNKIAEEIQKKKAAGDADSPTLTDSSTAVDALEIVFESLYGITEQGQEVVLAKQDGNSMGIADTTPAFTALGGILREGRALYGDLSTDPSVNAAAETRLLGLGGLGEAALNELKASHVLHSSPSLTPSVKGG